MNQEGLYHSSSGMPNRKKYIGKPMYVQLLSSQAFVAQRAEADTSKR
jgi:hypothetical protein|tara:strand:- start:228 stop:368 length:141 start_codon:yes stop_codon:yes gene_type:complete